MQILNPFDFNILRLFGDIMYYKTQLTRTFEVISNSIKFLVTRFVSEMLKDK